MISALVVVRSDTCSVSKRLRNEFTGVLTGKSLSWGGSLIRPEATGYGTVYFAKEMLATKGDSFEGKRVVISGSGNVAQFAAEKCQQLGAKVITMSDSSGHIVCNDGLTREQLEFIMELKNVRRGRIKEAADAFDNIPLPRVRLGTSKRMSPCRVLLKMN